MLMIRSWCAYTLAYPARAGGLWRFVLRRPTRCLFSLAKIIDTMIPEPDDAMIAPRTDSLGIVMNWWCTVDHSTVPVL